MCVCVCTKLFKDQVKSSLRDFNNNKHISDNIIRKKSKKYTKRAFVFKHLNYNHMLYSLTLAIHLAIYIYHWRRKRGHVPPPPHFFDWGGGAMVCLCPPPPLLTPHFYFPLELYVYITLTNNYLAFFIYQLIILWTISIN